MAPSSATSATCSLTTDYGRPASFFNAAVLLAPQPERLAGRDLRAVRGSRRRRVRARDEADATRRRFTLPAGHVEPFTGVLSPNHLVPLARLLVGVGKQMDALVEAYRSGGVTWAQHGADAREEQAAANRRRATRLSA